MGVGGVGVDTVLKKKISLARFILNVLNSMKGKRAESV